MISYLICGGYRKEKRGKQSEGNFERRHQGTWQKGKVCEVSDGYARNFLIPRGMVIEATSGNIQDLTHKQKQEDLRKRKEKDEAEALKRNWKACK